MFVQHVPSIICNMGHVTRRKALQFSGSAILAGLAGCSTVDSGSAPNTTLGEIEVTNLDFRRHRVSVLIIDDDEPVYSAEMDAGAAEPEGDDSSDVASAGGGLFEGFPTEVEESVLYAWRDGQPIPKWKTFDFRERDASCLGLDIQIGDTDQANPGNVFIYHTDPHACEDTRNRDS